MRWVNVLGDLTCQPSSPISEWLTKPYILSHALRKVCQDLSVKVISQHEAEPFLDEKQKLHIEDNLLPLIREIFLQGDGVPLTYARVVIPSLTYQENATTFDALGSRPLGETILYNNPSTRRDAFEYTVLSEDNDFALTLFQKLPTFTPQPVWARRSVFWLHDKPLLITEFFLPSLPIYPTW